MVHSLDSYGLDIFDCWYNLGDKDQGQKDSKCTILNVSTYICDGHTHLLITLEM